MIESEVSNGIKISGWGAALEAHGYWVSSALLVIIFVVGFIILRDGQIVLTLSEANYYLEIRRNQDDMMDLVNKLHAEQAVQTWLMSMPFEARPAMITPEARNLIDKENMATRKLYEQRSGKGK